MELACRWRGHTRTRTNRPIAGNLIFLVGEFLHEREKSSP